MALLSRMESKEFKLNEQSYNYIVEVRKLCWLKMALPKMCILLFQCKLSASRSYLNTITPDVQILSGFLKLSGWKPPYEDTTMQKAGTSNDQWIKLINLCWFCAVSCCRSAVFVLNRWLPSHNCHWLLAHGHATSLQQPKTLPCFRTLDKERKETR